MTAARDYAAAADVLEGLGQAVRERREALGLGWHDVAEQANCPLSDVIAAECETPAALALLRWLARTSEET